MHNYPSDISRGQFELIRAELEQAKHKTKPRKYDLYDIFCAVLSKIKAREIVEIKIESSLS